MQHSVQSGICLTLAVVFSSREKWRVVEVDVVAVSLAQRFLQISVL